MNNRELKILLLLGVLFIMMLACTEGTPIPSQSPDVIPVHTQGTGEPSIDEPTQYRVYIPEARTGGLTDSTEKDVQIPVEFDPHVIIEVDRDNLSVGETVTIIGRPVQIGLPYYSLTARDEGVQDDLPLASVSYDNVYAQGVGASQTLEFVSVQADMTQVTFMLRARAAGVSTVTIHATGEIYMGYPGPERIVGDGSGSVVITVSGQ
ncbi:MAG TPA: hypothetical protein VLA49_12430 [Anaerolineales bacterium]|nr:hypothetical protein [Anaerolineales bacterium]